MAISAGPVGTVPERTDILTSATPPGLSVTVFPGDDRLLVVTVVVLAGSGSLPTITGITYGGVALSNTDGAAANMTHEDADDTKKVRIELWYLIAPAVGQATLQVTFSGALASAYAHVTPSVWTGVHQTVPLGTWVEAKSDDTTTAPTITVNAASASDEYVIGVAGDVLASGSFNAATVSDPAVGAGQTRLRFELKSLGSPNDALSISSYEVGAGTTTVSFAPVSTASVVHNWVIGAVPIKPSSTTSAAPDSSTTISQIRLNMLRGGPKGLDYENRLDPGILERRPQWWAASGMYPLVYRARLHELNDAEYMVLDSIWQVPSVAPAGAMGSTQLPTKPSPAGSLIVTTQDLIVQYPFHAHERSDYPVSVQPGENQVCAVKFSEWDQGGGPYTLLGIHARPKNAVKDTDWIGLTFAWDETNEYAPTQWQSGEDLWFQWGDYDLANPTNLGHVLKVWIALYDGSSVEAVGLETIDVTAKVYRLSGRDTQAPVFASDDPQ